MKKRNIVIAAASAGILLAAATAQPAIAYFTSNESASGQYTLNLSYSQKITETFSEMTKHVVIDNTDSGEVFVRVKAFAPDGYSLAYSGDGNWSPASDGYYYYALPLAGASDEYDADSTSPLDIKISVPSEEAFDVVVVYEAVPVLYDEDGNAYQDWNQKIVKEGDVR